MGHFGNCLDGLSKRTSKRSCEKASRRLRTLIAKARRWGLTTEEVAELPAIKKLVPTRITSSSARWTTLAMIALVLGGGMVLAYICAPCITRNRTWSWYGLDGARNSLEEHCRKQVINYFNLLLTIKYFLNENCLMKKVWYYDIRISKKRNNNR